MSEWLAARKYQKRAIRLWEVGTALRLGPSEFYKSFLSTFYLPYYVKASRAWYLIRGVRLTHLWSFFKWHSTSFIPRASGLANLGWGLRLCIFKQSTEISDVCIPFPLPNVDVRFQPDTLLKPPITRISNMVTYMIIKIIGSLLLI